MGKKAEAGSQKWLANKMKSKGMQKLRWYCQVCEKQCRDQNGFKCHLASKSHLENMALMQEGGLGKHIDAYSQQFEEAFMQLLSTRYCGSGAVLANEVYQDFIRDRDHVHMTATQWTTLTDFIQWLSSEEGGAKVLVSEDERGRTLIEYVDQDPAAKRRRAEIAGAGEKKKREARTEQELEEERMRIMVGAGSAAAGRDHTEVKAAGSKLDRAALAKQFAGADGRVQLAGFGGSGAGAVRGGDGWSAGSSSAGGNLFAQLDGEAERAAGDGRPAPAHDRADTAASTLDRIRIETEQRKSAALKRGREAPGDTCNQQPASGAPDDRADCSEELPQKGQWVCEGLVVKVLDRELQEGRYFKKKGRIFRVNLPPEDDAAAHDFKVTADLRMLDPPFKKLRIAQDQLETVIPKPGGGRKVMLVSSDSRFCGHLCELLALTEGDDGGSAEASVPTMAARVKVLGPPDDLASGDGSGRKIHVDLDDICRWEAFHEKDKAKIG